jgi:hypothetical protein
MTPRQKQLRNRKIIKAILVVAFFVVAALVGGTLDAETYKAESAVTEKKTVTETTKTETETETKVTVSQIKHTTEKIEPIKFFDVSLSAELQLHIFKECEKHNIAPTIIIAMIERESRYDPNAIGDNGKSFGLMQIQPIWFEKEMAELGITDLLDPFQNVTLGIRIMSDLKDKDTDLYWVLMAYNGGMSYANKAMENEFYSDYAQYVVERASELAREIE